MEGSALPSIGTLPDATAEAQQPAADHLAVGQPADEQAASTAKRKHAEETSESGDTRKAKRSKGKASRAKEEKKASGSVHMAVHGPADRPCPYMDCCPNSQFLHALMHFLLPSLPDDQLYSITFAVTPQALIGYL